MKVLLTAAAPTIFAVLCCLLKSTTAASSFLIITSKSSRRCRLFFGSRTWSKVLSAAAAAAADGNEHTSTQQDDKLANSVSIGFIGFGTIAHAIATGLLVNNNHHQQQKSSPPASATAKQTTTTAPPLFISHMAVSRRSIEKSTALAKTFPDTVSVYDDNQEIVNQSDIIFLTVLPNQTAAVLQALQFTTTNHHNAADADAAKQYDCPKRRRLLVSLVSTATVPELSQYSRLPAGQIYKMICLPAVRHGQGVCLLQMPPLSMSSSSLSQLQSQQSAQNQHQQQHHNDIVYTLCQSLGSGSNVFVARSADEMSTLMVLTGMMGPFYGLLKNHRDFVLQQQQQQLLQQQQQQQQQHNNNTKENTTTSPLSKQDATLLVIRVYENMLQDAAARLPSNTNDDRDDSDDSVLNDNNNNDDLLEDLIAEQTIGGINEQALHNLQALGVMQAYHQVQTALLARIRGESDGSL